MSPSGQMQERGPPSPLQQPPPPTNVPPDVIQQSHSVVAPTSQEAIMPHVLATSDGVDQRMAPPLPAASPAHVGRESVTYPYVNQQPDVQPCVADVSFNAHGGLNQRRSPPLSSDLSAYCSGESGPHPKVNHQPDIQPHTAEVSYSASRSHNQGVAPLEPVAPPPHLGEEFVPHRCVNHQPDIQPFTADVSRNIPDGHDQIVATPEPAAPSGYVGVDPVPHSRVNHQPDVQPHVANVVFPTLSDNVNHQVPVNPNALPRSTAEPHHGSMVLPPETSKTASISTQEQIMQPPKVEAKPEPTPMSLASLLQGEKKQPKKKASDVDKSLQNPVPMQSFTNTVQDSSSPLSAQERDNHPFDSRGRVDEGRRPEHDPSDPRDTDSPENSKRKDDPYYDRDRRDPYYEHDRRDYRRVHERRDYDRHEYGRREYDRMEYDRMEYDYRDRREFDRRESDHSRRDYDPRDYDRRRSYDRGESYDNRDAYYGYGSPRQGRRSYDDHRTSREDLYRVSDPAYPHSYYSGRSTPSSDRNSPSYDNSSTSYPSHHYGYPSYPPYPSYPDTQSMDMYQYLTMLYYYYPQHYDQYCAQLGYYNTGYTPEQMAQYYNGTQYPPGYQNSQPVQGMYHCSVAVVAISLFFISYPVFFF